MTSLTAKRGRVPVKVSYRPITGWVSFGVGGRLRYPTLGPRTPEEVICEECEQSLDRGQTVYAVETMALPRSQAPDICPVCRYQFPRNEER
jgi:hypothetical protein